MEGKLEGSYGDFNPGSISENESGRGAVDDTRFNDGFAVVSGRLCVRESAGLAGGRVAVIGSMEAEVIGPAEVVKGAISATGLKALGGS